MKICSKCKVEKQLLSFNKDMCRKDGFFPQCKECKSKFRNKEKQKILDNKRYQNKTEEYMNIKRMYSMFYYLANKQKCLNGMKIYSIKNKVKYKKYFKKYYLNNKERRNETIRKRYKQRIKIDPIFKLTKNIRTQVGHYLKTKGFKKNSKLSIYLGCTKEELKNHLEKQFKPGMTWENYGVHGWHVDHIIPLSSAKTNEEIYKLFHYTNLQPLWAIDNIKKSNKYIKENHGTR